MAEDASQKRRLDALEGSCVCGSYFPVKTLCTAFAKAGEFEDQKINADLAGIITDVAHIGASR